MNEAEVREMLGPLIEEALRLYGANEERIMEYLREKTRANPALHARLVEMGTDILMRRAMFRVLPGGKL